MSDICMACEEGRSEGHIVVEVAHTLLADLRAQLAETDRRSLERLQQNSLLDAENEGLRERLTKTKAQLAQVQAERDRLRLAGDGTILNLATRLEQTQAHMRRLREALATIINDVSALGLHIDEPDCSHCVLREMARAALAEPEAG